MGISPPQFALLDQIAASPKIALGELASRLGVSSPTVSAALKRLRELGLVAKHRDRHDRRNVRLSLTQRGEELRRAASEFRRKRVERLLAGLSPGEREELWRRH